VLRKGAKLRGHIGLSQDK
jgi:hypothetical protein